MPRSDFVVLKSYFQSAFIDIFLLSILVNYISTFKVKLQESIGVK